jgi:hypothetical protein
VATQVKKEPKEVQKQRQLEAAAANAAQRAKQRESADKKTRMKVRVTPLLELSPQMTAQHFCDDKQNSCMSLHRCSCMSLHRCL